MSPLVITRPYSVFDPCAATSYSAAILADTPVAYWRMGDLDGTTVRDCTGNGHDGVEVGSNLVFQDPGLVANNGSNTAVQFQNTNNNYISIPNVAALKPTAAVSIEYWVDPDQNSIGLGGVGDNNPPNAWGYWAVYGITSQRFRFFLGTDVGPNGNSYGQSYIGDQNTYAPNNTYHVVCTYSSGDRRIYVNGVLEDSDTKTGLIQYSGLVNAALGVDFGGGALQRWYDGHMDEVAIYNYQLSPAQVLAHYNAGI